MLKIFAGAVLSVAAAIPAWAGTAWTFEKISFPPRAGWCPTLAAQALEVRPCGEDFPALSIAVAQRNGGRQDLTKLAAAGADQAATPEAKKAVLDIAQTGRENCEENSYAVQRAPMPGVASFAVVASYVCNGDEEAPVPYTRLTAYAQAGDGSVWTVGFDHPAGPISDADRAMIKSALAKISGR
jgi:hypothetical protein